MNRKLNYGGPLKSDYAFLCPDKLEPSEDAHKQPVDYVRRDSLSYAADLDKAKPSRFQQLKTQLKTWLNTPVRIL